MRNLERPPDTVEGLPLFNADELAEAATYLQNGKIPGLDSIPAEVLRVIAHYCSQLLLYITTVAWEMESFTRIQVILINKGMGDLTCPSEYRPLCILLKIYSGKLLERPLKPRLWQQSRGLVTYWKDNMISDKVTPQWGQ